MIHYHGLPISGKSENAPKVLGGCHAMISYADQSQLHVAAEMCQSFCFDNGAFSAWKSGKPLDVEGYAQFIDDWMRHPGFDFYVIPDVIDGTPEDNTKMIANWRNICGHNMLDYGAPVWHMHEPLEMLAYYCHAYQRVCLGSSGQYSIVGDQKWWGRMAEAMEVCCDDQGRPKAKLHGLRMLDPTVFSHIPLASADSTSMARALGIDQKWKGTYAPKTAETRAAIMRERIEAHCSASRWSAESAGVQQNYELFG